MESKPVQFEPKGFGSDNHASVHPAIIQSLINANVDHAHSYGLDPMTERVEKKISELFETNAKSFFVFNGTAANILALKACTRSYQTVLCSDVAHIHVDECAGPEIHGGYKLMPVKSENGKVTLDKLKSYLIRRGDQHYSQVKTISLTQPTELGTVYTTQELKAICDWAKSEKLYVHLDGSRFANACVSLKKTFAEMTTAVGVDVVSFGGTKNGLMGAEIVVFLNAESANDFKYLRKQLGQLPSKSRFLAAQFDAYLQNDLWKEIAAKSLKSAAFFDRGLRQLTKLKPEYPVESNAAFVKFPKAWIKELKKERFFYVWDEATFVCRIMFSWDTTENEIQSFLNKIVQLEQGA
ncbi:MAG: threonine aldolase [Bdellovibrio sp. 28-41-41]|nr:MAG: threonine aldolase [Bdellovibrio sp. 28-41-41]